METTDREDCTPMAWYPSLYAPRTGGAYDSHHRTAGIAGRTRRRGSNLAACGARAEAGDAGGRVFFVVHRFPMRATSLLASRQGLAMMLSSKTFRASWSIGLAAALVAAVPPGRMARAENIVGEASSSAFRSGSHGARAGTYRPRVDQMVHADRLERHVQFGLCVLRLLGATAPCSLPRRSQTVTLTNGTGLSAKEAGLDNTYSLQSVAAPWIGSKDGLV